MRLLKNNTAPAMVYLKFPWLWQLYHGNVQGVHGTIASYTIAFIVVIHFELYTCQVKVGI